MRDFQSSGPRSNTLVCRPIWQRNAIRPCRKYQKIRDLLAHCRMWDSQTGIAYAHDAKAKAWEVLVTDEALDIFYRRIDAVKYELLAISGIFTALSHRVNILTWTGPLEGAQKHNGGDQPFEN